MSEAQEEAGKDLIREMWRRLAPDVPGKFGPRSGELYEFTARRGNNKVIVKFSEQRIADLVNGGWRADTERRLTAARDELNRPSNLPPPKSG